MRRTTIYLPDELHADLERLARRIGSTLADLVRYAAKTTFADEFDIARRTGAPRGARRSKRVFTRLTR